MEVAVLEELKEKLEKYHGQENLELYELERQRERKMFIDGRERYMNRVNQALPSTQNEPHTIITTALENVVKEIQVSIEKELKVKVGRPVTWLKDIKDVNLYSLAMLALNTMLDGVSLAHSRASILANIGERVELENLNLALIAHEDAKAHKKAEVLIKKKFEASWTRVRAIRKYADKFIDFKKWGVERHKKAAEPLLNAVLKASDCFEEYSYRTRHGKTRNMIGLTEEASQRLADREHANSWQEPILQPMIVKPHDWVSVDTGGYIDPLTAALVPLIRQASFEQMKAAEHQFKRKDNPDYIKALNLVQQTPYEINRYAMLAIQWSWDNEKVISKFPIKTKIDTKINQEEFDAASPEEQRYLYDQLKKRKLKNREIDGRRSSMSQDLKTANDLCEADQFFIVWNLDTRGRIYPTSAFNFHREDYMKSMFLLKRGKVLDEDGVYWLAVHIANCGDFNGISKKPLEERMQWTLDNYEQIYEVGTNFEKTFDYWRLADKPFQFLAACNAWAKYTHDPKNYKCGLAVNLDGSSSGTQHYAAASLSKSDGALVNLVPQDKPADLYSAVSDLVKEKIQWISENHVLEHRVNKDGNTVPDLTLDYCKLWTSDIFGKNGDKLFSGITRSVLKRNVMTFAYSSVKYGFAEQLMEDLVSKFDDHVMRGNLDKNPFGGNEHQQRQACFFLAAINYFAVKSVLSSVSEGMSFFQSITGTLAHDAKHLKFITPVGFPMMQKYTHWETKKIKLFLWDRETKRYQRTQSGARVKDNSYVDKRKSKAACAPNIIHAMDSCHLLATVNKVAEQGVNDFFLIHDSFGTVPTDTSKMFYAVREAFIEQYTDYCLFQDVLDQAKKQLSDTGLSRLNCEIPKKGNLVLNDVFNSDFCFA